MQIICVSPITSATQSPPHPPLLHSFTSLFSSPFPFTNLLSPPHHTTQQGGTTQLMRIPPSVLKLHNKKDDAWSAINGKVYNLTPYLPYHPGGERELMRVAGRDGTKLFGGSSPFPSFLLSFVALLLWCCVALVLCYSGVVFCVELGIWS